MRSVPAVLVLLACLGLSVPAAFAGAPTLPGHGSGSVGSAPDLVPAAGCTQCPLDTGSVAEPPVNLTSRIPSLPGGSWSEVTGLLPLSGTQVAVLGTDNGTQMPKTGTLSLGPPVALSDTSSGFLSTVNVSVASQYVIGQSFGIGELSSPTPTAYYWDASFNVLSPPSRVWAQNPTTGAAANLSLPPDLRTLYGGASDGSSVLLVGQNLSFSGPETLLFSYNASSGFQNLSGKIPATFGVPSHALGSRGAFLLTTNRSQNTFGILSYNSTSGWTFQNLSGYLPAASAFTSPAVPLAVTGNYVLLQSLESSSFTYHWGVFDLATGSFVDVTSQITSVLGTPSAFAADSRVAGTNFTLASPSGAADLDAALSTVSPLSLSAPWTNTTNPLALLWMGSALVVGGYRNGMGGFLTSWTPGASPSAVDLPTGFVSGGSLVFGDGRVWMGGWNGTQGDGFLVNLSTRNVTNLESLIPSGTGLLSAAAFGPDTLYLSDSARVFSYNLSTGAFRTLPSPAETLFSLGWVNSSLWAGGILPLGGGGLFSYAPATGNWTNLSSQVTSITLGVTAIIPGAPGDALLGGESGTLSGDLWYYNSSGFLNVSTTFGLSLDVPNPGTVAWNGSAFWVLNGSQPYTWVPGSFFSGQPYFIFPVPTSALNSIAVWGSSVLVSGTGNESANRTNVPVVYSGTAGAVLNDLTPLLGGAWYPAAAVLYAGGPFVIVGLNLNGTLSFDYTAPPLQATLYSNSTLVDAPASIQFSVVASGGVPPYGSFAWNVSGLPSQSGSPVTYNFTTGGSYTVNVSFRDQAGVPLNLTGTEVLYSHFSVSLSASPINGTAPLSVTANWNATGGVTPYGGVTVNFGDGSVSLAGQPATGSASHVYSSPGTYNLTVNLTDSIGGTARQTVTIDVTSNLPPLAVSLGVTPSSGKAPLSVKVSWDVTGGATPYGGVTVDFGDTSAVLTGEPSTGTATHTYASAGNYTVTVNATDASGAKVSQTQVVQVSAGSTSPPPTCTSNCNGSNSSGSLALILLAVAAVVVVVLVIVLLLRRRNKGLTNTAKPGMLGSRDRFRSR